MNPLTLLTTIAVMTGAYAVFRWLRAHDGVQFQKQLVRDAAEWAAPHLGAEPAQVEEALAALVTNGTNSPLLAPIYRIECEVEQTGPEECRRTLIVALGSPDTRLEVGRVTRTVPWAELPGEVRQEFIGNEGRPQQFVVLERRAPAA